MQGKLSRLACNWRAQRITDHAVTRSPFTNRNMHGNYCSIDPRKKKKVFALSLLVVTKLIYAVFTLKDLKPLNRSTRIVHTDLFSSWKPLFFSVRPCFHLRSESTVLGCKLNTKCRTFNPLNFLPLRIESFSDFFLQKHPNSRKINQR